MASTPGTYAESVYQIIKIGLEKFKGKKFSEHQKCPSCMIGKSQLNNYPDSIPRADLPLKKVTFDLITSKITSIEGYNYGAVLTNDCSEYRWEYGLKTKDDMIDVAQQWYAEIAELRQKYQLLVVLRDNAGENSSKEIKDFFTSKGVMNYFSTPYEPWQDGISEASIKSLLMLTRTEMAESGMAGRFWFSATIHAPRAVEAIHLGFASDMNMSSYKFWIPSTGQIMCTNQARFDEELFPYRNKEMIDGRISEDNEVEILSQVQNEVKWIEYAPYIDLNDFEKVHVGDGSEYILRSITKPDVYMKVSRESFFQSLLKKNSDELLSKARALVARMEAEPPWTSEGNPTRVKGLPSSINPSKPPRSYRDAMTREDRQEWGEAYLRSIKASSSKGPSRSLDPQRVQRYWTQPLVLITR